MPYVVGIDASTTATKAVLVDAGGAVVAIGSSEYGYDVPQPGWTEQSPELWWDGAVEAVRSVLAATAVSGEEVAAVGLTGQMHGLVLLDERDAVLRPAILWNDQRTAHACDEIREAVGPERLIAITGNTALTGFTAPKLVWVRDHEPGVWSRVAQVLLPKDYVRLRLTGEHALDKADGAGTLLFDLDARVVPGDPGCAAHRAGLAPADVRGSRGHGARNGGCRRGDRAPCRYPGRGRRGRPGGERGRGQEPWSRGSSRSRWGRPASSSPRPSGPCATRPARCMRSATRSRGDGTS